MILLKVGAFLAVLLLGPLYVFQAKLIYFPHPYDEADQAKLPWRIDLDFITKAGKQRAYYLPPKNGLPPKRVWLWFSGNAQRALDWEFLLQNHPNVAYGILLIDYPGYGASEGEADPDSIEAAGTGAAKALETHLGSAPRWGVMGHSLGAAAALLVTQELKVDKVILLAPFTSMQDMACNQFPKPVCYLLTHPFDNRALLTRLLNLNQPPQIYLFHGSIDKLIPVAMGQELARLGGAKVFYQEVEAGHNGLPWVIKDQLLSLLAQE